MQSNSNPAHSVRAGLSLKVEGRKLNVAGCHCWLVQQCDGLVLGAFPDLSDAKTQSRRDSQRHWLRTSKQTPESTAWTETHEAGLSGWFSSQENYGSFHAMSHSLRNRDLHRRRPVIPACIILHDHNQSPSPAPGIVFLCAALRLSGFASDFDKLANAHFAMFPVTSLMRQLVPKALLDKPAVAPFVGIVSCFLSTDP